MQETIDLFGGHEEHFIEHFLQIIFLHILHNKEQLMHIIFLHKLFSQVFEQGKHILILHIEQTLQQLLFEQRLHLFVTFFSLSSSEFLSKQSLQIKLLMGFLLHKEHICLRHLIHFIPHSLSKLFSCVILSFSSKNGL